MESKRSPQNAVNNLVYYRGGSYALVGLNAAHTPIDRVKVELLPLKESS
jgi:hypothetical protein